MYLSEPLLEDGGMKDAVCTGYYLLRTRCQVRVIVIQSSVYAVVSLCELSRGQMPDGPVIAGVGYVHAERRYSW